MVGLPTVGKKSIVFELTGSTEKSVIHRCKLNDNYYELILTIYDRVIGYESYIKSSDGILFIFDKSSMDSFTFLQNAIHQLKEYSEAKLPRNILVGNKMDLEAEVSQNTISSYQWKYDFKYIETSGYSGKKVEEALKMICSEMDEAKEFQKKYQAAKKSNYTFGLFDSSVSSMGDTIGTILRPK